MLKTTTTITKVGWK